MAIKQHPYFKYILAGVLVLAVGFTLYKVFRHEKIAISEFTLTASTADAAGINPDSTFILKSTVDLDESVVEKYLLVEPKVGIKINKTGTNTFEIKPAEKLPENKIFAVKIDTGPIADKTFSWAYQVKAPFQVIGTLPREQGTQVPLNSGVETTFNRENILNPESYFEILPNIPGRFELHRNVLAFVPAQDLQPETIYTVRVKKGLKIKGSDDTLPEDKIFSFETQSKNDRYGGYSFSYQSFGFERLFWEFRPDNEPAFSIYSYNVPNATGLPVAVYKFANADEFISDYKSSLRPEYKWSQYNRYIPFQAPADKKIFEGNVNIEEQSGQKFIRLPQKLGEGQYLINIVFNNKPEQAWFQITNVTNYLAVSGTQSLIWLKSGNDGSVIAGADVLFGDQNVGKTNSDGVAQFNTPNEMISKIGEANTYTYEPVYFYTVKTGGKELAIPIEPRWGGFQKITPPDHWWEFLSFDKTIYQPSDTLRFWGIVKQRTGSDIRGEKAAVQLTNSYWYAVNPKDITVYGETEAEISDYYTVTGEIDFSGLTPGIYQLSVKLGDEIIISNSISVASYLKPAYKLTLTPEKNAIFAGDPVNFKVKAEFFDGTPVSNLQVGYDAYYQSEIKGKIRLNGNGEGNFSVSTTYSEKQSWWWPNYMNITVSPAVSEEGEISDSRYVMVFGPRLNLRVQESNQNETAQYKLTLNNIDLEKINQKGYYWDYYSSLGAPAANYPITAEVFEVIHKQTEIGRNYDFVNKITYPVYQYSTEERSLQKTSLTTDQSGMINFSFLMEKEKYYKVVFSASDRTNRSVSQTRYAARYDSNYSYFGYLGDTEGVYLKNLDEGKNSYAVGDDINLQIQDNGGNPPASGNRVFMFYRLNTGIDFYYLSDSPTYTDTFKDNYIPGESFVGVWFDGKRFHDTWMITLPFDSESKRLQIDVTKNKDQFKPGEEAGLQIQVKDKDGKPRQAEVNISALDEAVYSINPIETDITQQLYRSIYPYLLTRSSHPSLLGLGAEKGGCFLAGTKIAIPDGSKNIEDIRIGNSVITRNNSGRLAAAKVRQVTAHLINGYLLINDSLQITDNHRLLVNGRWQRAGQIRTGDKLLDMQSEEIIVNSVTKFNGWNWVYNFEVESQHTYFANGIYVHNEEKGGGPRGNFKDVAIYKSIQTDANGKGDISFKLPDNITSWRLNIQAISKDWLAGKSTVFIPVSLPFFVETALNKTYLAGDNPILRVRVFGAGNFPGVIDYKIESDTLPFKTIQKTGSAVEDIDIGELTQGNHEIKISATAGNFSDSIIRSINVVNSYFEKKTARFYEVTPSLSNIKGQDQGYTQILLTSQERGKLYWPLRSFLWSGLARVDQAAAWNMAGILLDRYFDEKQGLEPVDLRQFQTQNGGISLLPYSDDDLALGAKFADLVKGEDVNISKDSLRDYFYNALNDRKSDLSRVAAALYGLSALNEPVLVTLQNIKNDGSLTLMDKMYVALALDTIGAKEEARQYYRDNFKPILIAKQPYLYVNDLSFKDNNVLYKNDSASKDNDIVLTAMLANLAGSLQEPEADALAKYVFENKPADTLTSLEVAGYIKKVLPTLRGGDISFTLKTNRQNETEILKNGEVLKLNLSADELGSLKFENLSGRVGLVSIYNEASSPDQLKKDNDIQITRKYTVNGVQTSEFNDGDLVRIELTPSFGANAFRGMYTVTDYLPSGLRAVTGYNLQPKNDRCYDYPHYVSDQKVGLITWPSVFYQCPSLAYYARVVTKGTYKAEPTLIQYSKSAESLNISSQTSVKIK